MGKHIPLIIRQTGRMKRSTSFGASEPAIVSTTSRPSRQRKDGKSLDFLVTISPVKDSTGRIIGASKVARDISQRRQSEIALRQSEERFAAGWRKLLMPRSVPVLKNLNNVVVKYCAAEHVRRKLSWQLLRHAGSRTASHSARVNCTIVPAKPLLCLE